MRKCIRAWREYEKRLRWWSDFQKEYIKRMGELKNNAEAFVFASETLDKTIHLKKLKDAIDAGRKLRKILLDMKKSERIRAGELKSNAEALVFASETLDKIIKYRKDMKKNEKIAGLEVRISDLGVQICNLKEELHFLKDDGIDLHDHEMKEFIHTDLKGRTFILNCSYDWDVEKSWDKRWYLKPKRK